MVAETGDVPGVPPSDPRAPARRRGLPPVIRYLAAAALVRCASGGAAVGLVSLAIRPGGGGAALGAGLAALLTAPYIAGPWLGRWLEGARDGRIVLAGAFAVFGAGLVGGAATLGRTPVVVPVVLITLAGLAGPLTTGGLSSRLAHIVGPDERRQRKAEGWDSTTYGMANIVGPAVVGAVAAATDPLIAIVVLGCGAGLSVGLTLSLPPQPRQVNRSDALSVRAAMGTIASVGPLRRIMIASTLTAVSMGGVMVIAVVLGAQLSDLAAAGATLAVAYGVGNITGSVSVALLPMKGEPEKLTLALITGNAVAIGLCALAPGYPAALVTFGLAGATSALLFTSTLTVRSVYSPPAARAQVFVTMAGTRMGAASAGTVLAGALSGIGPRLALAVGAGLTLFSVAVALVDRGVTRSPASRLNESAPVE